MTPLTIKRFARPAPTELYIEVGLALQITPPNMRFYRIPSIFEEQLLNRSRPIAKKILLRRVKN